MMYSPMMSTSELFFYSGKKINARKLHNELLAYEPSVSGVTVRSTTVDVSFSPEVSSNVRLGMGDIIAAHDPFDIDAARTIASEKINKHFINVILGSGELVYNGNAFSIAKDSQSDWTALAGMSDAIVYPIQVPTKSGGLFAVNSSGELSELYGALFGYCMQLKLTMSAVLGSISVANTQAEIDGIVKQYTGV